MEATLWPATCSMLFYVIKATPSVHSLILLHFIDEENWFSKRLNNLREVTNAGPEGSKPKSSNPKSSCFYTQWFCLILFLYSWKNNSRCWHSAMNMLNAWVIEVLRIHSIKTAWSALHPFPIPLDLLCLAALRGEEADRWSQYWWELSGRQMHEV